MFDLQGRVALVTGGGRGIGLGIAEGLAGAGADVVVADIQARLAEQAAESLRKLGRRALAVEMDVTDPASVGAGVERALGELGQVDILVNNAGVVQSHVDGDATLDDFDRCYDVNLKGIWIVSQALIPHFRERRRGKIVNIASIAGRRGGRGLAPYSASKAGAISLTQSLAGLLGPDNVNVNAVCPGLLWTDMWRKIEGMIGSEDAVDERAAFEAFLARSCPLRREQTPQDVAHAVVFLVSDEAHNITGQSLNVDGGIEMS